MRANVDYPMPRIYLYLKNIEDENFSDTTVGALSEQLQENYVRGCLEIVIYADDTYYDKRCRETIYENIGAPAKDVRLSIIFIYTDKIDISNR